jgi:hypothetical protein
MTKRFLEKCDRIVYASLILKFISNPSGQKSKTVSSLMVFPNKNSVVLKKKKTALLNLLFLLSPAQEFSSQGALRITRDSGFFLRQSLACRNAAWSSSGMGVREMPLKNFPNL